MKNRKSKIRLSLSRRLLILAEALALLCAFSAQAFAAGTGQVYRGVTGVSGLSYGQVYPFRIQLSPEWFVYGDNTVYFEELARFAAIASNAVYGEDGEDSADGEESRENTGAERIGAAVRGTEISGDGIPFLEGLGFRDVCRAEVTAPGDVDENDVTELLLGHISCTAEGKNYEILVVVARGSVTAEDWLSNADIGADTEAYYQLTGEHPEWTDKSDHKGFSVTAARAYEVIEAYCEEKLAADSERIVFLTGHSRGGAVANLLGRSYEDREDVKSFCYTFASPRTTTAPAGEAGAYATIFNLINEDDIVPELPAENWGGFKRYGTDLFASGDANRKSYRKLTGESYLTAEGQLVTLPLSGLVDSREAIYEIDEEKSYVLWDTFSSKEEAESCCLELQADMEETEISAYFRILLTEKEENGKIYWEVGSCYRPAYAVEILAQLLSLDSVRDFLNFEMYEFSEAYVDAATEFITPVLDGSFLKSHMPAIYFCLAGKHSTGKSRLFIPLGEYLLILWEQWKWELLAAAAGTLIFLWLLYRLFRRLRGKRKARADR